jgi:COP9 signalosome complex subunit 1
VRLFWPALLIRSTTQLLTAVSPNPRAAMALAGLDAAKGYEKEALERVRRMSLAAADLEVRGNKRTLGGGINDKWYDQPMQGTYAMGTAEEV